MGVLSIAVRCRLDFTGTAIVPLAVAVAVFGPISALIAASRYFRLPNLLVGAWVGALGTRTASVSRGVTSIVKERKKKWTKREIMLYPGY